jgi:hypothetical protein
MEFLEPHYNKLKMKTQQKSRKGDSPLFSNDSEKKRKKREKEKKGTVPFSTLTP